MRALIAAVRSLLSRARFERDMREELAQHVQHRADDHVTAGISREEALRQARLEFGAFSRNRVDRAFEWLGKSKATGRLDMTQMQVDTPHPSSLLLRRKRRLRLPLVACVAGDHRLRIA